MSLAPGVYKARDLLARPGLAASKSDAERLLRQRAVKRDGAPVEAGAEIEAKPGDTFVLSIGSQRYVRFTVAPPDLA